MCVISIISYLYACYIVVNKQYANIKAKERCLQAVVGRTRGLLYRALSLTGPRELNDKIKYLYLYIYRHNCS